MKISILDANTIGSENDLSVFNELGNIMVFGKTSAKERIKNIADSDIVITNKVIIDKQIIDACPTIKLICITATGMNNVDLDYAAKKGITVKNVAGYSTDSVAQTTFAVVLELLNKTNYYSNYVKSGEYSSQDAFTHIGPVITELKDKKWGVIGLGNIGRRVAEIATVFGCDVQYYSTSGTNNNDHYARVSLDVLLETSDIISIHAPLNDATDNLITAVELDKMKPTAYVINMGRGGIVNESDLANVMQNGNIAGAAIDVMKQEPIEKTNPLLQIGDDKLIILPHIAWSSVEARRTLLRMTKDNIIEFLRNK